MKRLIATALVAILLIAQTVQGVSPVLVGISSNPCDCDSGGFYSDTEYRDGIRLGIASGADIVNATTEWDNLEEADGVYDLDSVERILEEANIGGVGVQLTIVTISYTGSKRLPTYLSGSALDSVAVTTAFNELMNAIYALPGSEQLKVLLLGNEVEVYLATHSSEISPFGTLLASARDYVRGKARWSGVHVTASFKHTSASSYTTTYADIATADTIAAFTYYPLNADFTVQYTNAGTMATDIFNDLNAIYTATGGQKMLLSEAGYPSSTTLNSSEVLQSAFVQIVGALGQVIGPTLLYSVNIEWMSDLPDWLLDILAPSQNNLREFIATLGYRDATGTVKASWPGVAASMRSATGQGRARRGDN
jgi:hypothetical protein